MEVFFIMSSEYSHNDANQETIRGRSKRPGGDPISREGTALDQEFRYPSRLLGQFASRGHANVAANAALLRNMQQTYGNRQTRRAVQRAVTIDDLSMSVDIEDEYGKQARQKDMSDEEKATEFMNETDELDKLWGEMSPHDREMMAADQQRQTRELLDMQETERDTDPEFYARCPEPAEDNCGLP